MQIQNHYMNVQKDVVEHLHKKHFKNMKKYVLKYFKNKENNLMLKNIELLVMIK